MDISQMIPRILLYMGSDPEDLVAQANADLRYSSAFQVTDVSWGEVVTIEGEELITLTVAAVYADTDGE